MSELQVVVLATLFDHLPVGLVVLDPEGRVVVYNRTEEQLAGRNRSDVMGRDFFVDVAPCMDVKELAGEFRTKIGRGQLEVETEFSFPFPFLAQPRDVHVRLTSFEAGGLPHALLTIEDVSFRRSVDRMRETLQSLLLHDLKSPLSAIASNLDFLQGIPALRDEKDAREAISDSLEASGRLSSMLVNLLDVTRLETNTLPLRRQRHDARKLVESVVAGARASARARGVSVVAELPAGDVSSVLDTSIVRRALDNLVDNAMRHAKNVVVGVERTAEATVFEVKDDGPGVPEGARAAIFEKHVQVAEHAATANAFNRGLGLTFVRLAARAHGGDVTISCPPGGGAVFHITLPHGKLDPQSG